jgi:uncharacterized protein YxeA
MESAKSMMSLTNIPNIVIIIVAIIVIVILGIFYFSPETFSSPDGLIASSKSKNRPLNDTSSLITEEDLEDSVKKINEIINQ